MNDDEIKAVIYAGGDDVTKQLEICENFATFYDYKIVGVATEIDTLFKTAVQYDAVIVTKANRITRNANEYHKIKNELLEKGIIIIKALQE